MKNNRPHIRRFASFTHPSSLPVLAAALLLCAGAAPGQAPAPAVTNPPPAPEGLVLHFGFDEAPVGFVIPDLSGHGNKGRIAGASWAPAGRVGGGCLFSSTDHFIAVPEAPSLNSNAATFMVWIKAADGITGRTVLERNGGQGFALAIGGESKGAARGRPIATVGGQSCAGEVLVADNFWHHLAATYDGETLKLYIDGAAQKQTAAFKGPPAWAGKELTVGLNRSSPAPGEKGLSYQGLIDEVRVYDRALEATNVLAIYSASKPKFSKFEVSRRITEIKELKERGLLLDEFYERKLKECEQ